MSTNVVLVTGGSGFVGSHLAERLLASGCQVRCLLRQTSSIEYLKDERIEIVRGDIAGGSGLKAAVSGAKIIFHVAGVTKARSTDEYYLGNVTGTENLIHACVRYGDPDLRFVLVSSLAAAGPSPSGKPMTEDVAAVPISHYGASKLEAEVRLKHSDLARQSVIVRPAVVYGPRDTDVLKFFRMARRGWLPRVGRHESYVSIIHARDVADGIVAAGFAEGAPGKTYFLANEQPVSWIELGRMAAGVMGRKAHVIPVPLQAARFIGWMGELQSRLRGKPGIVSREKVSEARCRFWICNVGRARAELGFEARTPLKEGVAETLAWYRERGWLKY